MSKPAFYRSIYAPAVVLSLLLFSCTRPGIDTPSFDVTVSKTTYAANEPVTFQFTGDADIISFYSGATGNQYKYRNRITIDGKPQMQFTSYYQASTQSNTLQLLVSKDFSGTYDLVNLQKATWTDISSRATLSAGTDNTPSGVIDLSDVQSGDSSVYVAFKYTAVKASAQPTWTIKNISIENKLADGSSVSIGTIANLSWGIVSVLNSAKVWTFSTTQLQFVTSAAGTDDNEDWIISKPLQLNRVQRDFGINVKSSPTTVQTKYVFAGYTTPGTYTVTFEAINANKDGKKTTVKEFTFTVQ